MPRYNVEYNGKWAAFTSIADGFITPFMDKEEYEAWRLVEYGKADYQPAERCNRMTLQEAIFSISLNRTRQKAMETFLECGLPIEECEQLYQAMEQEHYCPVPDETMGYKCPNCSRSVYAGQGVCRGEDCELSFVWRI